MQCLGQYCGKLVSEACTCITPAMPARCAPIEMAAVASRCSRAYLRDGKCCGRIFVCMHAISEELGCDSSYSDL